MCLSWLQAFSKGEPGNQPDTLDVVTVSKPEPDSIEFHTRQLAWFPEIQSQSPLKFSTDSFGSIITLFETRVIQIQIVDQVSRKTACFSKHMHTPWIEHVNSSPEHSH